VLESYLKWFVSHERILALLIIMAVIAFAGNKYLNYSAKKADLENQTAQAALAAQKASDEKQAAVVEASKQHDALVQQQANAQIARLSAEMDKLSQSLAARQKTDQALPAPELALRHEALLGVSSGVANTENGFQVSTPVEIQTVQSLESLPVLKQQLSDETAVADNRGKQLDSSTTLVVGLNQRISGLNLQLTDSGKACDAKLADIKANARKSKRNWFIKGAAAGAAIIGYIFLHV